MLLSESICQLRDLSRELLSESLILVGMQDTADSEQKSSALSEFLAGRGTNGKHAEVNDQLAEANSSTTWKRIRTLIRVLESR